MWINRLKAGQPRGSFHSTFIFEEKNVPNHLIHAVENQGIPPHGDGRRVVSKGQAVGTDEQPFGTRECPDGEHAEQVDKVAQIGQEVVVSLGVVGIPADGHEIRQLCSKPVVEVLWAGTDEITTDKDVEHTRDEGRLFTQGHRGRLVPLFTQTLDTILHAAAVLFELLVGSRHSTLELAHDSILGVHPGRPQLLALFPNLLALHVERMLPFLESLRQLNVVEEVEDGELVERRKSLPVLLVGAATGEGRFARELSGGRRRRVVIIVLEVVEERVVHHLFDGRGGGQGVWAHGRVGLAALARVGFLHDELLLEGEEGRTVPVMGIRPTEEATEG